MAKCLYNLLKNIKKQPLGENIYNEKNFNLSANKMKRPTLAKMYKV